MTQDDGFHYPADAATATTTPASASVNAGTQTDGGAETRLNIDCSCQDAAPSSSASACERAPESLWLAARAGGRGLLGARTFLAVVVLILLTLYSCLRDYVFGLQRTDGLDKLAEGIANITLSNFDDKFG